MPYKYTKYVAGVKGVTKIVSAKKMTLEQLQKHVGGDIEVICLPDDLLMVINENGIALDLPFNGNAYALVRQPIRGNAIVCDIDAID